ncbi:MAG: SWIM zinc finger family protein [Herpetosiphonaceae bacterium]|nr:SWIM zinc finger family protein [Herpetosiphonaceae bacterium]
MPGWYDDEWFPHSQPRSVKNGLKAKNVRGTFGSSWWAKRWIDALERLGMGSRLQRGRSYARDGQVVSIDLTAGRVKAKVQGSQRTPYKVNIAIAPLDDRQWELAIDRMAEQAIFAAKLLAGEMPQAIEEAFTAAGVALFPQNAADLVTDCSCPDFANPCKHIAAVYYLLGERFDEDPFLIFQLRGRTRDQIIEALRVRRASASEQTIMEAPAPYEAVPALADLLSTFYQAGSGLEMLSIQIAAPEVEAGILRRLGSAPGGVDADMQAVYRAMTEHVLNKVFGGE